tara:strand:+ start:1105 stop:1323 length:219 start_codon:yes stop_codon:yes gene_type:complete
MAVHQVEEYYVFIQFKNELTDEQYIEVSNYMQSHDYDYDCTKLDVNVDFVQDEMAADEFDSAFSKRFSNLIK